MNMKFVDSDLPLRDGDLVIDGNREGHAVHFNSREKPPTPRVTTLGDTVSTLSIWHCEMAEWRKKTTFEIEFVPHYFNHKLAEEQFSVPEGIELSIMSGGDVFDFKGRVVSYAFNDHADAARPVTIKFRVDV